MAVVVAMMMQAIAGGEKSAVILLEASVTGRVHVEHQGIERRQVAGVQVKHSCEYECLPRKASTTSGGEYVDSEHEVLDVVPQPRPEFGPNS